MSITMKSLIWASLIIGAAIFSRTTDMSDAASFGLISSMVGAAVAMTAGKSRRSCGKACN